MPDLSPDTRRKLAGVLGMLGSDYAGERDARAKAIRRRGNRGGARLRIQSRNRGQSQQHIAVARQRCAPTDKVASIQLVQRTPQMRLKPEPSLVCVDGSLAVSFLLDSERVRPLACRQSIAAVHSADVDGTGRDEGLPFAEAW